jgi:DNA transformation protein and related proteins
MSEFVKFLHEVFADFGPINSRKMFGGHGIYHDGLMFGLVADDTLYLKADETTKQQFIDKDLSSFEYDKKNKKVKLSYYLAPEEIYDDPDEALYWARLAFQAALNSKSTRKKTH